jgi:hypothetical protein
MSWREWAAAQYNHVLSIMKDTMDKTLFVIDRLRGAINPNSFPEQKYLHLL